MLKARLPTKVQLVRVGEEPVKVYTPPPEPFGASLPTKVQLETVGEEWSL